MASVIPRKRTGIALFGLGRAGQIHAPNLSRNPRVDFRWLVEDDIEKAKRYVKENCLDTQVVTSEAVESVLQDSLIEACVICTPTFTHENLVLQSLRAGKAVFCEKPIATTLAAIDKCYEEAERVKRPLLCAFNRRFDPGICALYDASKNGTVGDIHMVKTTSRDSPLPSTDFLKISGGIFHDCAVHDIDVICWILGQAPTIVYAQAHAFLPQIANLSDVDTVAIVLKFPSGTLAQIDLSRFAAYGYDQRLEVFGNKGMLVNDNLRPTALQFSNTQGTHLPPIQYSFPTRYDKAYELEMEHFLDVIAGKDDLKVTKADTMLAVKVASACEISLKTGKAVEFSID